MIISAVPYAGTAEIRSVARSTCAVAAWRHVYH